MRISAEDKGDWVEFTVADNGPGIDPQHHERIFQVFQTLKPRDQVEGSGIGLAVVKKTVENQGGEVALIPHPARGATFCFTWPQSPLNSAPVHTNIFRVDRTSLVRYLAQTERPRDLPAGRTPPAAAPCQHACSAPRRKPGHALAPAHPAKTR